MNSSILPTLEQAIEQVRAGGTSRTDLWRACSSQIEHLNPGLNAFITVMEPDHDAESAARRVKIPDTTALEGVPIAVKDLFETAGVRTTAGTLFFKDYVPEQDAEVVAKVRAAGGAIIGKTNTHECALGVTTANPHYGVCHNPWKHDRIPGGSSGGSAVAVAVGMAFAALGTDTGGSIRIPASLCGIVGLKPTYGRASLRGVFPLSWNLDHAGPLTRSVRDAAILLQVISGFDPDDPYSIDVPVDDYIGQLEEGVAGWRIALASGRYFESCEPDVLAAVEQAAAVLTKVGADVKKVELSSIREAALANGIVTQADGATYHRQRLAEHPELFGSDVRKRLETGRDTPTADYILARDIQARMKRELTELLAGFEIIMLPTTAIVAPPIEGGDAVEQARRLTRFTAPFNLTGLPAISLPCGFSAGGLPIGLQLVARPWGEAALLRAARAYERETGWGSRLPTGV